MNSTERQSCEEVRVNVSPEIPLEVCISDPESLEFCELVTRRVRRRIRSLRADALEQVFERPTFRSVEALPSAIIFAASQACRQHDDFALKIAELVQIVILGHASLIATLTGHGLDPAAFPRNLVTSDLVLVEAFSILASLDHSTRTRISSAIARMFAFALLQVKGRDLGAGSVCGMRLESWSVCYQASHCIAIRADAPPILRYRLSRWAMACAKAHTCFIDHKFDRGGLGERNPARPISDTKPVFDHELTRLQRIRPLKILSRSHRALASLLEGPEREAIDALSWPFSDGVRC